MISQDKLHPAVFDKTSSDDQSNSRLKDKLVDRSQEKSGERHDRRFENAKHAQKLSPRHEEQEMRRSGENASVIQDDAKRRREDELWDRKRDEREVAPMKMDERERDKGNVNKEDSESNASKRRKLKREHIISEPGEYLLTAPPPPSVSMNVPHSHNARDRADRKRAIAQRPGYVDESGLRAHSKEAASKPAYRDIDPMYEREWNDEKRQRAGPKRRHRK